MDDVGIAVLLTFIAAIVGVFMGLSNWFDKLMKNIGNWIDEHTGD